MNEGKMFGNQGSPEQIKAAEERMSPLEEKASKTREEYLAKWKEAGLDGELYSLNPDNTHYARYYVGTINGHKVKFDFDRGVGKIDDRVLSKEQIDDLWKKYKDLAAPFDDVQEAEKQIQETLTIQKREEMVRQREEEERIEAEKTQALVDELLK
ncbi:MAG: hypothetical protein ACD_56C00146G0016 [uncultured bacterium]|nr:MAG: hypothetical protein ACD_56C00146G0016 [uncultured bacterium]